MQLLCELLNVKENRDHLLLEENILNLMEDLGNLKDLKMGPLINAFKQTYNVYYGKRGATSNRTGKVESKFTHTYTGIGRDSEIVEYKNAIKKFGNLKKAFVENPSAVGAALYLDDKPVIMLVARGSDLLSIKNHVGIAWDFSKVLSKDQQEEVTKLMDLNSEDTNHREHIASRTTGKSQFEKVHGESVYGYEKEEALKKLGKTPDDLKKVPYKDYMDWVDAIKAGNTKVEIEKTEDMVLATIGGSDAGKWDKKKQTGYMVRKKSPFLDSVTTSYGKVTQFQGITQTIREVSPFIEKIGTYGVLTCKLILVDEVKTEKAAGRRENRPVEPEKIQLFKDDIKTRLKKYKVSKIESIDDVKVLVQKIIAGELKKINFAGSTYHPAPSSETTYNKHGYGENTTMKSLFTGKTVSLKFVGDHDVNGHYGDLNLYIKLVKGTIVPVKIDYRDSNSQQKTETF